MLVMPGSELFFSVLAFVALLHTLFGVDYVVIYSGLQPYWITTLVPYLEIE